MHEINLNIYIPRWKMLNLSINIFFLLVLISAEILSISFELHELISGWIEIELTESFLNSLEIISRILLIFFSTILVVNLFFNRKEKIGNLIIDKNKLQLIIEHDIKEISIDAIIKLKIYFNGYKGFDNRLAFNTGKNNYIKIISPKEKLDYYFSINNFDEQLRIKGYLRYLSQTYNTKINIYD